MLSFQQQSANPSSAQPISNPSQAQNISSVTDHTHVQQHLQSQSSSAATLQSLRLREEPPPITPAPRNTRKRKSPPSNSADISQTSPPPPPPPTQPMQHVLPPPHALIHPLPGPLPPGYQYAPPDYTPGGLPPSQTQSAPSSVPQQNQQLAQGASNAGRTLSQSKRAEQNRKAQRAFRERRDQHVKALESRSQLLDAALASADEANRRWEECRALVDQLRVENAALRAALSQAQMLPSANVMTAVVPAGPPPTKALNAGPNVSNINSGVRDKAVDALSIDEPGKAEKEVEISSNIKE